MHGPLVGHSQGELEGSSGHNIQLSLAEPAIPWPAIEWAGMLWADGADIEWPAGLTSMSPMCLFQHCIQQRSLSHSVANIASQTSLTLQHGSQVSSFTSEFNEINRKYTAIYWNYMIGFNKHD